MGKLQIQGYEAMKIYTDTQKINLELKIRMMEEKVTRSISNRSINLN